MNRTDIFFYVFVLPVVIILWIAVMSLCNDMLKDIIKMIIKYKKDE